MANPTTNYSFAMPTNTDLVKDLPADFEIFGQAVDTQMKTNADAAIAKTIVDAKGDIIAATAADTVSRLAVGANNTVLTADSSTATGLKWAAPASSSTFVGVAVTNANTFNVTSGTEMTVTFDSEFYDTDAFHSTSTNTDRLTVPSGKAGKYLVVFTSQWQANESSASVIKHIRIQKNGNIVGRTQVLGANSNTQQTYQTTAIVDLAVADYINVTVYTSSSNNSDLYFSTTTPYYSYLSMAYLGA